MNNSQREKIQGIIQELEEMLAVSIQENINEFDHRINYNNYKHINTYEKCPHCGYKGNEWIAEVADDLILKVKCTKCGNNYYTDFGR